MNPNIEIVLYDCLFNTTMCRVLSHQVCLPLAVIRDIPLIIRFFKWKVALLRIARSTKKKYFTYSLFVVLILQ